MALVLAAIPFFLVRMPPVMDFPNHLTRIWLLAGGAKIPPLSSIYDVRWWQATTNVSVDFVSTALAHFIPLTAVGRILLLVTFLGPPLAAVFLNRALFGHFSIWHLAAIALVWSTTAVTGLISYQIGLAAALLLAVGIGSKLTKRSAAQLAVTGASAAFLLLIHPFGALFFLLLTTALILGDHFEFSRAWLKPRALHILAVGGVCLVPVVLLFVLSPHPPGANGTHKEFMHWEPLKDVLAPQNIALVWLSPILSYKLAFDLLAALPVFGAIGWATLKGRLRFHAGLLTVAALILIISPFLPMNIGDGGAFTIRFPMMAALMAFAGVRPEFPVKRELSIVAAVLFTAVLFRVTFVSAIWLDRAKDVDDLKTVASSLPAGASVLVLQQKWSETQGTPMGRLLAGFPGGQCASERHLASLVVIWRHVFIPTLFTVPGQQPLGVKPPWKAKAVYSSGIPFLQDMNTPTAREFDPYLTRWRTTFDYVLLLNADFLTPKLAGVHLVAERPFVRLYRVER